MCTTIYHICTTIYSGATIIYYYIPLYTIMYHYIPLYTTIYHYIPVTIYHYIPLYTIIYHYIQLYTTIYHHIPLYTTIYHLLYYVYHYIPLLYSYNVQGHIHHKATNVQERVLCGTLTGRLRDHSDPFEFRPTPIHATPFETKLIHGIYCPSMALVLALLNRWVIMRPHRICCCYLAVITRFKGGPIESMGHDVLPQTLLFCHKDQGQPC